MSTILVIVTGNVVVRVVGVVRSSVDADLDPRKQSVVQPVAEVQVFREGVVGTGRLLDTPHVFGVGGDILRVGVVRVGVLHGRAEHLVPEQLSDMGDAAGTHDQGAVVLVDGSVQVGQEMGVGSASVVVAGENGVEGDHAVFVGVLDAAQVGRVPAVGGVVARGRDTAVGSLLVAILHAMTGESHLYTPVALACQMSTKAPSTGRQVLTSMYWTSMVISTPSEYLSSFTFWRMTSPQM